MYYSLSTFAPYKQNKYNNMQYSDIKDAVTIKPSHELGSSDSVEIVINIPDGSEIDVKNSDLAKGIIKLKRKNITLEDVYENQGKDTYLANVAFNNVHTYSRISAIAYLMDIAKYYNGDWKPDWSVCNANKFFIYLSYGEYKVGNTGGMNANIIFFKNEADAQAVANNSNFKDILDAIYKN